MISCIALAAAVTAVIAGCTADPASGPSDPTATRTPVLTAPAPPPPAGKTGAPTVGIHSLAPVPVAKPSDFGNGLVATVSSIVDVPKLAAQGPGEVAGPGVSVTIDMHNASKEPVDLSGVDVNASYGGKPADSNQSPPAAPLKGTLDAGKDQKGVYVFQVSSNDSRSLMVQITWNGSPNIVLVQR